MTKLITSISSSVIETFTDDIHIFNRINSEIGYGEYISIYSFEAFLQDYSQITNELIILTKPNNFGLVNSSITNELSITGSLTTKQYYFTPQTNIGYVKNKVINNFTTNTDICIFYEPEFNITGATKIFTGITSGNSAIHLIETATSITLGFVFTSNTSSFTANSADFKYDIYKYNTQYSAFNVNRIYGINGIKYSAFSGTNTITQSLNIDDLNIDGEFLIKGFYDYKSCTDYLERLDITYTTNNIIITGDSYGYYRPSTDYYFAIIRAADTPIFRGINPVTLNPPLLHQQIIEPNDGQTVFPITQNYLGEFIVTLNGLVLANDYDYTISGYNITLTAETNSDDIITIIYASNGTNGLTTDIIDVLTITSGITGNQGNNKVYFNTTTNKFEIYLDATPVESNTIFVMINGVTLANNIDYYQSISEPKRIILEGNILIGDILTVVYYSYTDVIHDVTTNTPTISWSIEHQPQLVNGIFTLEISTGTTFSNFSFTATTPYVIGQTFYYTATTITGSVGTTYYYRVKNNKQYITLTGDIINSIKYSEIIPITIQSNSINSY